MESLSLGRSLPRASDLMTFVWIAAGPHGEPEAAFVIDGRDTRPRPVRSVPQPSNPRS